MYCSIPSELTIRHRAPSLVFRRIPPKGMPQLSALSFTPYNSVTGAATALLAGSASALGLASTPPPLAPLAAGEGRLAASALATAAVALACLGWAGRGKAAGSKASTSTKHVLDAASSGVLGALFAVGLAISRMTLPAKVVAFLSVGTPGWDPSLALVMGSALAIAMPAYHLVKQGAATATRSPSPAPALVAAIAKAPVLATKYSLPTATRVDAQLLLGGVLFGVGWGLSGLCPGPALVNGLVGAFSPGQWHMPAFLVAMGLGMKVEPWATKLLVGKP
ncbi:hypothetical protein QJQ45_000877 [Haematococcus lacustris]|nr:hypothetical protein QJQ45_000877 [Haematococcus lacustris]